MVIFKDEHTRWQVAPTHCNDKFLCVYWGILWKPLSPQQNFVPATSHTNSNQLDLFNDKILLPRQRFSSKFSSTYRGLLLQRVTQLVAWPVANQWFVILTCCSRVSPSVFRTLGSYKDKETDCNFAQFCLKKKSDQRIHVCVPSESFLFLIHW